MRQSTNAEARSAAGAVGAKCSRRRIPARLPSWLQRRIVAGLAILVLAGVILVGVSLASGTVAVDDAYATNEDTPLVVAPSTSGLQDWWGFNEGSPSQSTASGGSLGTGGTLGSTAGGDTSDPTWSAGYVGANGLTFDGAGDYVQTTSSYLKTASSFTLSAWFQTNSTTTPQHILWQGYPGGNGYGNGGSTTSATSEMSLSVGSHTAAENDRIVFSLGYDIPTNGADSIYIVSASSFTDTTRWHNVAVSVADIGGGRMSASLYIDGKFEGTDTGAENDRSVWDDLRIGAPGSLTRSFNGQIDEVRIYSSELTGAQIKGVAQPGVLANDTDVENDLLRAILVTGPSNGTLSLGQDGSFTYTPNANFNGSDSFTYKANDGADDSNVATVTITVTPVNDAPVLSGANDLASINRNLSSNPGTPVASLIGGQVTDVDVGAVAGIAVTNVVTTNGVWQYSTNGGSSWTSFTSPDPNNARLLAADGDTYVRFVPNANWSGTVSSGLTFRAWDKTSGTAGTIANSVPNGGTTAFSTATASASIVVTAANTAPTLSGANDLSAISEDPVADPGTPVSTLIAGKTADVDPTPQTGIAVTAVDNSNGVWQYSLNSGAAWSNFDSPSTSVARLLNSDAGTNVRFVPNANWNGTVNNGITFRAWDRTNGASNGGTADVSGTPGTHLDNFGAVSYGNSDGTLNWATPWVESDTGGGSGPTGGWFSVAGNELSLVVRDTGNTIYREADLSTALGATLSFYYRNALGGAADLRTEISSNGGASYTPLAGGRFTSSLNPGTGTVSLDISAHRAANTRIRFSVVTGAVNPDQNKFYVDNVKITATANSGGSTAFSTASASASVTVTAVNDPPQATNRNAAETYTEDTPLDLVDIVVSDVDGPTTSVTLTLSDPTAGSLSTATSGAVTSSYDVPSGEWSAQGALADVNVLLAGVTFTPTANSNASFTIATSVSDTVAAPLTGSKPVTSNAVNDAPVITGGASVSLAGTDEDTPSPGTTVDSILTDAAWSDVDSGAQRGIAVRGTSGNGTWQYSDDGIGWVAFGPVWAANALLLDAATQIRYLPDNSNGETVGFDFVAWDQSAGVPSTNLAPSHADAGTGGGTTPFSSQASSGTLTVSDANDAPVITSDGGGGSASVGVAENTTAVTTVVASDQDVPAQTLTYSISGGVDSVLFAIDPSSGALSFVAAPDFESPADSGADNVYDVDVRVSDGTLTDTQQVAVTVSDANDAPVITSDGGGGSASVGVAENTTAVTTVVASDQDVPAQTLTYSISGGVDSVLFAIDPSSGALSFVAAPDFESPADSGADNVYDVDVRVSDGTLTDTQQVAVTVSDANDAPVITSDGGGGSASVGVAENTTAVTTVVASDQDVPAQTLTYSISGGVDSVLFAIDPSSGALSFVAAPDFESPADSGTDNVYDVDVRVSDGIADRHPAGRGDGVGCE